MHVNSDIFKLLRENTVFADQVPLRIFRNYKFSLGLNLTFGGWFYKNLLEILSGGTLFEHLVYIFANGGLHPGTRGLQLNFAEGQPLHLLVNKNVATRIFFNLVDCATFRPYYHRHESLGNKYERFVVL